MNTTKIINSIIDVVPAEVTSLAEEHGYELYAVGGCLRNAFLGRQVGEIDLAVVGDATILAKEIAKRMRIGKVAIYSRYGTAMLNIGGRNFEFATARRESYDPDSRKPSEILTATIDEDLKRRDFTVNALALSLIGPNRAEILDRFDGITDLQSKTLRTPLDPTSTFSDDPLRMLRAVRFAAEYDFQIDDVTWDGIKCNLDRLKIVAWERVGDEFWKMLQGSDPARAMQLLVDCGLMREILPEVIAMAGVEQINRHHHKDVLRHSLQVLDNISKQTDNPVVRLAGLLHDVGKPTTKRFDHENGWTFHGHEVVGTRMCRHMGRRLKIGHQNLDRLCKLVRLHMRPVNLTDEGVTDSAIRRLMVDAGEDIDAQLVLCRADITTANPKLVKKYLKNFDEMARRMGDVEAREKMRRFQSPLRGDEIAQICGIEPGPMIGALKERIEDAILEGVIPYDHDASKDYLIKIKDEILNADPDLLANERKRRAGSRRKITQDFEFPDIAE